MVYYSKTHIKVIRYKDLGWIRMDKVWSVADFCEPWKTFSIPKKGDLRLLVEQIVASEEGL
jgi:hypothetical protein